LSRPKAIFSISPRVSVWQLVPVDTDGPAAKANYFHKACVRRQGLTESQAASDKVGALVHTSWLSFFGNHRIIDIGVFCLHKPVTGPTKSRPFLPVAVKEGSMVQSCRVVLRPLLVAAPAVKACLPDASAMEVLVWPPFLPYSTFDGAKSQLSVMEDNDATFVGASAEPTIPRDSSPRRRAPRVSYLEQEAFYDSLVDDVSACTQWFSFSDL
jgi:hypothetical protein